MWARCTVLLLAVATLLPSPVYPVPPVTTMPSMEEDCEDINFDDCAIKEPPKDSWVVCYYAKWAKQRAPPAHFTPKDIDASLCTHVSYAFSILDSTTLTIKEWAGANTIEDEIKTYKEITDYKSKGLTVMMSIGGSDDSLDGDKWSRLISSDPARGKFVSSVMEFLDKYKFDGLDVAFSANKGADKEKFTKLITELKAAFNGKYLLSTFGTSNVQRIEKSYDMAAICKLVDWVNMGSYEYHSSQDETTGPQAPICKKALGFGVYDAVKYYLDVLHCPPEKVVLGVAFFASSYTLKDPSKPQYGVLTAGPGNPGPNLNMAGYLAYYEACKFSKDNEWTKGFDKVNGEFLYKGNQFVSSPTINELTRKTCLIKHLKIKGINLWTMDYDDVNNECKCGNYPLLHTLNKHLRGMDVTVHCY